MKIHKPLDRCAALLLTLALLLSLASCGNEAKATTMHLKRAEGTVAVSDDAGEDVPLLEDLGLYSGYEVDTRSASFAWIDLDSVKLTKMDQDSEIAITQDGKQLEIEVKSGSLFFNVTQPLAEDETMNIRTSTMMVGIRGTCGWVTEDTAALLEGTVSVTAGDREVTINAGEMGTIPAGGEITVEKFSLADVPAYVMDEVEEELLAALPEDGGPAQGTLADTGMDVPGGENVPGVYADALVELETEGEILYTEMIDFEADGNPELLVLFVDDENNPNKGADYIAVSIQIYRDGPEGVSSISKNLSWDAIGDRYDKISLAESGGRLYIQHSRIHFNGDAMSEAEAYFGSTAQQDGSGENWGLVDSVMHEEFNSQVIYERFATENGLVIPHRLADKISAEEYTSVKETYEELRVLAYSSDGKNVIITPALSEMEEFFPLGNNT